MLCSTMTIVSDSLNAWARLEWRDPAVTLRELRALELATANLDVSDKVRRLRTGDLKHIREGRNAALFSHGMATATGNEVYFAPFEAADYDFVTSWIVGDERLYCPVQLKELPPSDLAPTSSLKDLLSSLGKYQQTDTVLALLLNRPAQLSAPELAATRIPFSQAGLFWCASPDQERWVIQGDILASSATYEFTYPLLEVGAA